MVTVGLGSILVGAVELIWGADPAAAAGVHADHAALHRRGADVARRSSTASLVAAVLIAGVLLAFRFWRGGVALARDRVRPGRGLFGAASMCRASSRCPGWSAWSPRRRRHPGRRDRRHVADHGRVRPVGAGRRDRRRSRLRPRRAGRRAARRPGRGLCRHRTSAASTSSWPPSVCWC